MKAKMKKKLQKIQLKIEKGKKAKDYCTNMLQFCKTWFWPSTSADELHVTSREHSEKDVFIAKAEMAYYADTHKTKKL